MPKPFIAKKDKQVISSFTSSWRDRTGREKFPDKSEINTKPHQDGEESGDDYEGEDDEYDEEYYEGEEGEEYTEEEEEEEYSGDEEHNKFSKKEDDLSMIGFKKDGFDYSKYMKPIGGGVFIPAVYDVNDLKKTKGNIIEIVKNSEPAPFMYGLEEISKDYKKDVKDLEVDDDIKEALLIDDSEDDFEDLDDDFILQANGGTLDGLQDEVDGTINKFKNFKIKNRNYDFDDDDGEYDEEYYEGEEYDDYDEEYYGDEEIKGKSRGEDTRRAQDEGLEAQFEIALEQYEEEDIGELEPEETLGACDVNNFNDVFDEFIADYNKNHESLSTQIEILKRDNGFIALTDREKELILNRDWNKEVLVEVSDNENEENEEDKWDCETILTTYTNLDNHPKLLREENPRKIKLSAKTGLPVKSLTTTVNHNKPTDGSNYSDSDDDSKPSNQGVSRKNESKELRKLRKQQLKEDRKNKRELKKDLKVAFKKEEIKQTSIIKDQKTNQSITVRY